MKNLIGVHIRWTIRRDMEEVLAIEDSVFEFPWSEDDFIRCMRQSNCIGMVAEYDGQVVGSMVYELHPKRLHILNFAVDPKFQGNGIGRQMMQKLIGKLSSQRRNRIMLEVRESNVKAQMFFKACGFRAVSVLKDFYEDTTEDAYMMQYRYQDEVAEIVVPKNRIAGYLSGVRQ